MLQETPSSTARFLRSSRLQPVLHAIVGEMGYRSTQAALRVVQLSALADKVGLGEDLTCLIELLQSCRHERWRQLLVLNVVKDVLNTNSTANEMWRNLCGFEAAVAALSSLDGAFDIEEEGRQEVVTGAIPLANEREEVAKDLSEILERGDNQELYLELIKQVLKVITVAISGKVLGNLRARVENRQYLKNEIGYDTLKCCLLNAKVLAKEHNALEVVECIFMMVTEEQHIKYDKATIKNADAVLLLFSILKSLPRRVGVYILRRLLQLISNSTYVASEQLCLSGTLRTILLGFRKILRNPEDPIYPHLLRLLCVSGRHRITVPDASSMLRCLSKPLFYEENGRILVCESARLYQLSHHQGVPKTPALEEQWKSLLILAELAETSDSVPFLRLGGGRGDLLSLSRKWQNEEPKEDTVYAAVAYAEGVRFVMIPTLDRTQPSASSSGFTFSCWFRFGVEETDYEVSSITKVGWCIPGVVLGREDGIAANQFTVPFTEAI